VASGLAPTSETLLDTNRVQKALNACPAGKAVELLASGQNNAFLIAPITLPKGVNLLVDASVTVFASRNQRDYDSDATMSCGTLTAAGTGCFPLINVYKGDGAGIMGYGVIDGRGELPMLINGSPTDMSWWDLALKATGSNPQSTPRMLEVTNTTNFTLYKITFLNSPHYHVAMDGVTNFTAWGIKIIAPYDSRNTDGIDPIYSNNVTITNSYISQSDDYVAVSSSNTVAANNVSITNNHFFDGQGASIGSGTAGGVSNVLFDHISIAGDSANRNQRGPFIKSDVSRGGLVQNVTYSNICMQNVRWVIRMDPFFTVGATGSLLPQFKDITIRNLHSTTEGLVFIEGHDSTVPTALTLSNVQIDGIKTSDITVLNANFKLGPDPVNFGSMLTGTGVTVTNNVSTTNLPYPCPPEVFSPIAGELIPGPAQVAAGQSLTVAVQVFTTKALPYQTYLTNLKTNPSANLALPAPTGTVKVLDGSAVVGTSTLNGGQLLRVPISNLSVGTHSLTAIYSGDSNYASITFGNYIVNVAGAPTITAVSNNATGQAGIASGSWVSIYGSYLASAARTWNSSDFSGSNLPTELDDVSVQINGKSAAVYYVSSEQLNVLAPADSAVGPVQVQVKNASGTATSTATLQAYAPGFFTFQGKYVAAVHTDGVYLAPAGYFGSAVASRPAQPDEHY